MLNIKKILFFTVKSIFLFCMRSSTNSLLSVSIALWIGAISSKENNRTPKKAAFDILLTSIFGCWSKRVTNSLFSLKYGIAVSNVVE